MAKKPLWMERRLEVRAEDLETEGLDLIQILPLISYCGQVVSSL